MSEQYVSVSEISSVVAADIQWCALDLHHQGSTGDLVGSRKSAWGQAEFLGGENVIYVLY